MVYALIIQHIRLEVIAHNHSVHPADSAGLKPMPTMLLTGVSSCPQIAQRISAAGLLPEGLWPLPLPRPLPR